MQDYIVRAIADDGTVRAFAADTTGITAEAKRIHFLSPLAAAALGRTLTAGAIMSKMLKGDKDTITIQIKGDGPLGGIIVTSDADANVRGYVHNPDVNLPLNDKGKFDVSGAIGANGYLNVIKDMGLKEPYIGYVNLISGEIAEDIAYYFAFSEQIPSVVSAGVIIDSDGSILKSGGFIIQLMPGADESTIEYLESRIALLPPVTNLLCEGNTPEDILNMILGDKGLKIIDTISCRYLCNCSRDRMERNIISLGKNEIMDIIEEQNEAQLECHFCNKKYRFSEEELRTLAELFDKKE